MELRLAQSSLGYIRQTIWYWSGAYNQLIIIDAPTREFLEGVKYSVVQTRYERHPKARKICLQKFGYKCDICKFDFERKYGPLGRDFIHVHHIIPVSEKGQSIPTDPEKDLIPVCPNCHAMLHRCRDTMHPDTLKEIIVNRNQEV
jgi:5-methylcytosine-specific restriction protein A